VNQKSKPQYSTHITSSNSGQFLADYTFGHVNDDVTWSREYDFIINIYIYMYYPNTRRVQYLENSWRCYLATNR